MEALDDSDRALLRLAKDVRDTGYRFVSVTPATHSIVNSRPGNKWARGLEDVFGWSRPFHANLLPASMLELMYAARAVTAFQEGLRSLVRMSSLAGELYLHSAYPTTAVDSVFFGPDTYRFAAAVSAHLEAASSKIGRAVDIGCGAGPGAIVIAKARPDAEVIMVDINGAALKIARVNAILAGADKVVACHGDLLSEVAGSFDLIIANPPYLVDPAMRAYRHGGGPLGAGLSLSIVETAVERLSSGGTLVLYTGSAIVNGRDGFREDVAKSLRHGELAWSYREVDPDVFGDELATEPYTGADRIAAIVLTATRKG